jgi:predicted nucleotidyltransferase
MIAAVSEGLPVQTGSPDRAFMEVAAPYDGIEPSTRIGQPGHDSHEACWSVSMSVGQLDAGLLGRLPLESIAQVCERFGVSQLWILGSILERDPSPGEEVQFLVDFLGGDAGPWGSKLDELENDLSGIMRRKVRVSSRGGVRDSTPSPWREQVLDAARLIYER